MPSAWHLLSSHVATVVGFSMATLLGVRLLSERRPTGSTVAWLLAFALIPYVGVPFYLVFGGRKLKRDAARKQPLYGAPAAVVGDGLPRMLCAFGAPPPREGNGVTLLPTGEAAWAALVGAIDGAERYIHVSTLILGGDEVGEAIAERLARKAAAGLQVRVLIDALFGLRTARKGLAALERAGGRSARFMPVVHLPFRGHANLRLHRKIVVVDGNVGIVGGMNLAREYIGPTPLAGRWRDLSVRVVGPAVADLDSVFAADWSFAAGEPLAVATVADRAGGSRIQVVGSGPDVQSDRIYDAILTAVYGAARRLWIATPYFVPSDELARALALAVRRGVDVRILVPARSNHLAADLAGAGYLRELEAAGADVLAYAPGMMHAKVVLVDDTLAAIGSANLDMRSLFLDYEIALFFSSAKDVQLLDDWFTSMWPACGRLPPAGRVRLAAESVARLVGPLV